MPHSTLREHPVIPIDQLDTSKLVIKTPKREGDIYFSKVTYDRHKCFVSVPMARVADVKHHSDGGKTLSIKLTRSSIHAIADIDEFCLEQTKACASDWFNELLTDSLIEEYFTTSISVRKQHGHVLKLILGKSVADTISELSTAGRYNLTLQLSGLKFFKKKLNVVWSVDNIELLSPCFQRDEADDGYMSEDETSVEPDIEHLCIMRNELHQRASDAQNDLSMQIAALNTKLEVMKDVVKEIEDRGNGILISDIEKLIEKLEEQGIKHISA
jgi:hypothetical protein